MPVIAPHPAQSVSAAEDRGMQLFRAFADPTRLRLLALLYAAGRDGGGEICVCDLVDILGVPQPTASRHLGYLRRVGLVTCRKEGAWCHYRLLPAADPLHRKLLESLQHCHTQIREVADDLKRLHAGGCCAPGRAAESGCC